MAFNKVFVALLLLAVVATTTHARLDILGLFDNAPFCPVGPTICASCKCRIEFGVLKCTRTDVRRGDCPTTCGRPCICDRSACPRCQCSYPVVVCPRICPTPSTTATTFENVLPSEIESK